jgi:membrane dipeptidase
MIRQTLAAASLFAGLAHPAIADENMAELTQRATDIHQLVLTLDTHVDIPSNYATEAVDPGEHTHLQVDLPKMIKGGLDAAFFIVFVSQGPLTEEGFSQAYDAAITKFEAIHRQAALYGHDVERLAGEGKLAAMIGVENGYQLGANLEHVQEYYDRGARYMSLTHMGNTQLADSSGGGRGAPDPEYGGLSKLGKKAIRQMNKLGVMVDVSHASKDATLQAIRTSKAPVIASHSALRAFRDLPRNISDDEVRAIAAKDGVVQLVAFDAYIRAIPAEKQTAMAEIREEMGLNSREAMRAATPKQWADLRSRVRELDAVWPRSSISDMVDQIDYAVELVGIDHVGISSDFGGGGGIEGWDSADQTFNVTLEMVRRGYSLDDIDKIWSGNLLRVWRAVEAKATELQAD